MDQMVREYSLHTGTGRWPVTVSYNMIDMAAMNSQVLYEACTGRQERLVDFLVDLKRQLANSHVSAKKAGKEESLRQRSSKLSPGKRVMCQVKHRCKNSKTPLQNVLSAINTRVADVKGRCFARSVLTRRTAD